MLSVQILGDTGDEAAPTEAPTGSAFTAGAIAAPRTPGAPAGNAPGASTAGTPGSAATPGQGGAVTSTAGGGPRALTQSNTLGRRSKRGGGSSSLPDTLSVFGLGPQFATRAVSQKLWHMVVETIHGGKVPSKKEAEAWAAGAAGLMAAASSMSSSELVMEGSTASVRGRPGEKTGYGPPGLLDLNVGDSVSGRSVLPHNRSNVSVLGN